MKQLSKDDITIKNARRIHLVGIGGSGMCPIAELLLSKGYAVSGSDRTESENTKRLATLGASVFIGQRAENVAGAQLKDISVDEAKQALIAILKEMKEKGEL